MEQSNKVEQFDIQAHNKLNINNKFIQASKTFDSLPDEFETKLISDLNVNKIDIPSIVSEYNLFLGRSIMPSNLTIDLCEMENFTKSENLNQYLIKSGIEIVSESKQDRQNDLTIKAKFTNDLNTEIMVYLTSIEETKLKYQTDLFRVNMVNSMKYEKPKNQIKGFKFNQDKSASKNCENLHSFSAIILFDEDCIMDNINSIVTKKDEFKIDPLQNIFLEKLFNNFTSSLLGLLQICQMDEVEKQMPKILDVAHFQNPKFGITGFLSYDEHDVFQYIEGPTKSIMQLESNIKKDNRQKRFKTIIKCPLKFRICPNGWHMKKTEQQEQILMIKGIYDALTQTRDQSQMNIEKINKQDLDE